MVLGWFGNGPMEPPPDDLLGASPVALGVGPGSEGFTWWKFMAGLMLPFPIVMSVIISTPCPRPLRKGVLWLVNSILVAKVRGPIQVIHAALVVSGGD